MNLFSLLFCLFIFTFPLSISESDSKEAVFTLTSNNFNKFMKEHPKVLVEFYAPWCGHCKALEPEYEKAAQTLRSDSSIETVLAKVDATEEKDLGNKYEVRGFPTLKYFTNGNVENPIEYTGGRTESTIVSWISQRALPPVTDLITLNELDTFKIKSRVVLISFGPSEDDSKILLNFAEENRDYVVVGRVTNNDVINELDGVSKGDIYIYKQFDNGSVKFVDSSLTMNGLKSFVDSERFPLIDEIGPENYKDYIDRGLPLVWIAIEVSNKEQMDNVLDILKPFANQYKGKLSFTYVDNEKYEQHVSSLGITKIPGLMIVGNGDEKFLLKETLTADSVKLFFKGYEAGTLEIHIKSEEIPKTNNEDIFVLVGKSFKNVIGKDKDVLVEFYAPWCGHCKNLAPEYEKVASVFKEVNDIVIAKIDATENDTPEEIEGFPTLIFYPKGESKGIQYDGERTADAIVSFIKTKATVDVSNAKTEL